MLEKILSYALGVIIMRGLLLIVAIDSPSADIIWRWIFHHF